MRIGITERGDAGLNLTWQNKLQGLDGVVLITKNMNPLFQEAVLETKQKLPVIVHCTVTGWGHSVVEPLVPEYHNTIDWLCNLIRKGFPVQNCVLRIDPIIPTEAGLQQAALVLNDALQQPELQGIRIRISLLDEYQHVKQRLMQKGYAPFYDNGRFYPNKQEMQKTLDMLQPYHDKYGIYFETCAEPYFKHPMLKHIGCISDTDLQIMGLRLPKGIPVNKQNRNGCLCLACKTELLTERHQCQHRCLYCYWHNQTTGA